MLWINVAIAANSTTDFSLLPIASLRLTNAFSTFSFSAATCLAISTINFYPGFLNNVIPVAMKRLLFQVHSLKFLIRHLPSGRVFPTIQTAGYLDPFVGHRASDQVY